VPVKDDYITVSQAAEHLGVSRQTISRWIADGKFPAEKMGRQKLIATKHIDSFKLFLGQNYTEILIMGVDHFVGYECKNIDIVGDIVSGPICYATVTSIDGKTEFIEILVKPIRRKEILRSRFKYSKIYKLPDTLENYSALPRIEIYYSVDKDAKVIMAGFRKLSGKQNTATENEGSS